MKDKSEIAASIGGTKFGTSLKDLDEGDFSRGYYDAAPEGNYEGSLEADGFEQGTLHAGFIEADGYRKSHGWDDEYGFVRRPHYGEGDGGDVERN